MTVMVVMIVMNDEEVFSYQEWTLSQMVLVIIDGQMSEENEGSRGRKGRQENGFIDVPSGLVRFPTSLVERKHKYTYAKLSCIHVPDV